jgi:hypothetical protein
MKTWLVLAMTALTADAQATGVRRVYSYSPSYGCNYYQPAYAAPVQQYAAPSYCPPTYQQTYCPPVEYQYPVQKVIAQEVAVAPFVITVPVDTKAVPVHAYGSPYYYSIADSYREKAYLRDLLREELRGLMGQAPPQPYGNPAPAQPPQRQQAPPPAAKGGPQAWVPDETTPPELQAKVIAAYKGRGACLNCHGADGKASGPGGREFRLVVQAGQELKLARQTADKGWKIYGMSSIGMMPPAAAQDANKAMEAAHLPALLQYVTQLAE